MLAGRLAKTAGLRERLKIFGTDYDTPDGSCIRDYIHVNDLARAHILGLGKFEEGLSSTELNLGTGRGYSNLEVVKIIEKITGLELPYDAAPRRAGDLSQLFAKTQKAKDVLGFTPKQSDLTNIINTAWNFHQKVWAK